jgi:Bacterial Ig-like domain
MRRSRCLFAYLCVFVLVNLMTVKAAAADFTLSVASLGFPSQVIYSTSTPKTILLTNTSGATLTFTSTTALPYAATDNCSGSVAAGANCTISVTFSPTLVGGNPGTLTIAGGATSTPVNLTGSGILPTALIPASLSFGNRVINSASNPLTFKLTNNQTVPLSNIVMGSSNPDFAVSGCPISIPPASFCTANVVFTPTVVGPRSTVITVLNDGVASGQTVTASGTGISPTTITPASLSFGPIVLNAPSVVRTFKLTNNQSVALNNIVIGTSNPEFTVSNCPSTLPAGGFCTANVVFTPTALGTRSATLTVTADAISGGQIVSATGTGILATTVAPTSLAMGVNVINVASSPKTFKITNNQTIPLTTVAISSSNADFAVFGCPTTINPGQFCTATVVFTPSTLAAESGTLTITDNAATSGETVAVSGYGVAPMAVSVPNLTFGSQPLLTTSNPKTLTLTNNQTTALNTLTLTTSAEFAATGCTPPIATGASCTISVTFTPTSVSPTTRTGTLTLTTPDAANSPLKVQLAGSAVTPVVLSPATTVFGNVTVGSTSAVRAVSIKNQANVLLTFAATPFQTTGDFAISAIPTLTPCGASLAPLASCAVNVTSTPTVGGTGTGTLVVNDDAPSSPQSSTLTVNGTTPVTVSPKSIAFGSATIGLVSPTKPILIQNNQAISISIVNISASGDFSVVSTTCGATLASTQNCTINVATVPTLAGFRSGSLTVITNTTGSPHVIPLTALGTVAVTESPLTLFFGTQQIGTTSISKQVTLTNHQMTMPVTFTMSTTGDFSSTNNCTDPMGTSTIAAGGSCIVSVTFTPTASGSRSGAVAFSYLANGTSGFLRATLSGTGSTIPPPATVASVSPGAGTSGTSLDVEIAGFNTHFNNSSVITFDPLNSTTPSGITATNLGVNPSGTLNAHFSIDAAAVVGPRNIKVVTPLGGGQTETARMTAAFVVSTNQFLITSITPFQGTQGWTGDVDLVAPGAHFVQGITTANFGDGIIVNGLAQVISPTEAVVNVTVRTTAYPTNGNSGWRTITLVTNGEFAISPPQGFKVNASVANLVSVSPSSGAQGALLTGVLITGANTHFTQNASTVSFGGGINIGNTTVLDPTHIRLNLAITSGASVGLRDVTVSTGGEIVNLPNAFGVTGGNAPYLANVSPVSGIQGQDFDVTLTGVNTNFDPSTTTLDFGGGSGIQVAINTVTATTVVAHITIPTDERTGGHLSHLTVGPSGGQTIFPFSFTVLPSAASISISPAGAPQGDSPTLSVSGFSTHFDQANTTAWFSPSPYCAVPTVNRITVNSATNASVDIAIPFGGCIGGLQFNMATGGEQVSAVFTVFANTPSVTVSPSNAKVGQTVTVNFTGDFTHFADNLAANPTTAIMDGTGISFVANSFKVTGPTSAQAQFVVDANAPIWPPVMHTITLTTARGSGKFEIVTTNFFATNTPAVLTEISPYHAKPGIGVPITVDIFGANTHFGAATTVGFGPNITLTGAPTIVGPDHIQVSIDIDASAALGWRNAFVNTGSEQVSIGFRIDNPIAPAIAVNITPSSGAQGQSLPVVITGQNTHWVQGTTEAIVGAGITVSNLLVTDATHATATIAISPTAPVGGNSVIMITGSEIASGTGFSVTRGISQITSVTPSQGAQNQTLLVDLVGNGTHWLQGETVFDFGAGIHVNSSAVLDAAHAHLQITSLSQATVGFHTVSTSTDGEYAELTQGFNVVQATPTLISSSPNFGLQGTTFDVQVLGRFTHWQTGVTTGSYGDGVTINSFQAVDSATGLMNVTVNPLAFVDGPPCRSLVVTTGTEQMSLQSQFCVTRGSAVVTNVNPSAATQSQTVTVTVTGQNTHWVQGLTTANFGPGINVSNVHVLSSTSATVDVAVPSTAPNGFHTVTMNTLGESAFEDFAFSVGPTTATLNGVNPNFGQQGETLTVHVIGQYTHFQQGVTTATFGEGITLNSPIVVTSPTSFDADLTIDPLTFTGGRTFNVATGGELESGSVFSVAKGPAIIADVSPSSGNQGQEIVLNLTGQATHWAQGFTQFSMPGLGYDIKVNYFVVNSPTSATADITIAPTAGLGPRSVYMVTGGEALVDNAAVVITGGIPSITTVSPNSGLPGDSNINVQIAGVFTHWTSGVTTIDFGPGLTVQTFTVNNDTSITAVVDIDPAAQIGYRTINVRTGAQVLTSSFRVDNPATIPPPYISYMSPSSGLPGQTFTVSFAGQFTNWDPATTQILFGGTGVTVNSFQVTSPTGARANITIDNNAAIGSRRVEITTGAELEVTSFSVVQAVPYITIVDPSSAMQGATLDVNVIGQYTTFDNTTVFAFGPGVTINNVTILGPAIATVNVTVGQLATLGSHGFTATTGAQVVNGSLYVTPSQAVIVNVTPNTAKQGDTITVTVTGQNTHWDGTTTFNFGYGLTVNTVNVTSATSADVSITAAALATIGSYSIDAQTQGEIAHITNGFVVQAGTSLILSSGPSSGQQQQNLSLTILAQFGGWIQGNTTVDVGPGITVNSVNVTSPDAMTVGISVQPYAFLGSRTITAVTTVNNVSKVLTLPNAFFVSAGPAAISLVTPDNGNQGTTFDVAITGTNTHFAQGSTAVSFGPGIFTNSVTVTDSTHLSANITTQQFASAGFRTVNASTFGESANGVNAFTINASSAVINFVNPSTGLQGETKDVTVFAQFTHFSNSTVFSFGSGVSVNSFVVNSATQATVNVTVSPTTALGYRTVSATTGTESASLTNGFQVVAGPAYVSAVAPTSGRQNQTGLLVQISGIETHWTATTPTVDLGQGVTVTNIQVISDTNMTVTVNISPTAIVQVNNVTVTTLGEVASLAAGFRINPGIPTFQSASPNSAHQGDTLNVIIGSLYSHFINTVTTADFGANITVNSVTVNSATQATVNITLDPAAAVGTRTITMATTTTTLGVTTTETVTGLNAFTILGGAPQLQSISPTTGGQGSTQTMTITGAFTHFTNAVSQVSFSGSGVTVGAVTVNGPTQIQVPVTVNFGATPGARTVSVTTNSEVVSLNSAFTVQSGLPTISILAPNVGVPNSTLNVAITGQFTNFVNGVTQANFGPGVSVNGAAQNSFGTVVVNSPTSATAALTIDPAATLGPRNITVQTNSEVMLINSGFTVQSSTPTAPTVASIFPVNSSTAIPVNTEINIQFTGPIDRNTVTMTNVRLIDQATMSYCNYNSNSGGIPATVTVDASGRVITLVPSAVLAVGRLHYVCIDYGQQGTAAGIKDPSGNFLTTYVYSFTTGFAPDNSGPAFIVANIADGDNTVPTNAPIRLKFSKPINAITQPDGILVQQGGSTVPGTFAYTTDYRQATFTPASAFAATTAFSVTLTSALQDYTGSALSNPTVFNFTTASGPDNAGVHYQNWTPAASETTGIQPIVRATFDKPLDPTQIDSTNFWVYNQSLNVQIPGTSVDISADRKTATLHLSRPLQAGANFYWRLYAYDRVGHYNFFGDSFNTTSAIDSAVPTVVSVTPPNTATNVPVNAVVQVVMSEPIDRTVAPVFSITPAVANVYSISTDNQTLTFTPSANLDPNTVYSVSLSGLKDSSGNSMSPYSWSFTTSASAVADTSTGTVSTSNPAQNATLVPRNTAIVLTFTKPINPVSLNSSSIVLYDTVYGFSRTTASLSSDSLTVTLTPITALAPNRRYCTYISNWAALYDWTNRQFSFSQWCFTTAYAVDSLAPSVVSVTPFNNATGIGPLNPVTVTMSKPMDRNSLTNAATIYVGSSLKPWGGTVSSDGTNITFNTNNLPYNTTFTVVIDPSATDTSGNQMASQFRSTFTTAAQPLNSRPSIVWFRPGAGATGIDPTTSLSFYSNAPFDPTSVTSSLFVSQNGALITGSVALFDNNQLVVFTPSAPLQAGALVQAWFTSAATDPYGNALFDYQASFTVAPDLTASAPVVNSFYPNCCGNVPTNSFIEAVFSKPIDPTSATTANFFLNSYPSGTVLSGTISQPYPNVLRFTPSSPLPAANGCYAAYATLTTGIVDTNGLHLSANQQHYFCTTTGPDNTAPQVTAIAPTNGSSNIGVNAAIRLVFNKAIDLASVTPSSLTLMAGGTPLPYSFSGAFGNYYPSTVYALLVNPQSPLPANTQVTVAVTNSVIDFAGLQVTPVSATFTTGAGADFSLPVLINSTISNGDTNVPVNSVFTFTYDRPIDKTSYRSDYTYLRDSYTGQIVPTTMSFNADGSQVTLAPLAPLAVNRQHSILSCYVYDLTGNQQSCVSFTFYTALNAPLGGPQLVRTNVYDGQTNIPVNFAPRVQFDRPISRLSTNGFTLTASGSPVNGSVSFDPGDTILTLTPSALLLPNTTYVLHITGMTDLAGTLQAAPVTVQFTTGTSTDRSSPAVVSATPLNNSVTGTHPLMQWVFNEAIDPTRSMTDAYLYNSTTGYVRGTSIAFSPDLMSATMTYVGNLDPNTRYQLYTGSFYNLAGYSSALNINFYTGSGPDAGGPTVVSVNPPDTMTGVPVNAAITMLLNEPINPNSFNPTAITVAPASPSVGRINLSTGLNAAGVVQFGIGNLDANWATTSIGGGTPIQAQVVAPGSPDWYTGWNADGPASSWIARDATLASQGLAGYSFTRTFDLTNYNLATVSLAGTWSIDDGGVVILNGTQISSLGYAPSQNAFSVPQGSPLFNQGSNTLTIVMTSADNTLDAVRLEAQVSGALTSGTSSTTPIPGVASIASDYQTLHFTPSVPFAPNTAYNIAVASNAYSDESGNNAVPFSSTFTTGSTADTSNGTINLTSPASGATGVALNSAITVTLSKPVDPYTVTPDTFRVFPNNNSNLEIAGNISVSSNGLNVTFTPISPLAPGTIHYVAVSYYTSMYDLTGRSFNGIYTPFTTIAGAGDTTPPQVLSVTPTDGGSNVGPVAPITLVFSKSINAGYLSSTYFAVYNGPNLLNTSVTRSSDNRTVTLTGNWPYATTLTVAVSSDIQDVTGIPMTASFRSTFTTINAPLTGTPSVTSMRPGNGATNVPLNSPITLFTSAPVNPATVSSGLAIVQNGVLFSGSSTVTPDGHAIVWTPTVQFTKGALVQIFVNGNLTDTSSNSFSSTSAAITIAPDLTSVAPVANLFYPTCCSQFPINSIIEVGFTKNIDPTTVSASTFFLSAYPSGTLIAGSISQPWPNLLQFTPSAPLPAIGGCYAAYFTVTTGLKDTDGNNLAANQTQYFCTSTVSDALAPAVASIAPTDGSTNIGDNASVRITFNKLMDTASINTSTVTLMNGATSIPYSLSFSTNNNATSAYLTPMAPLPHNATITVNLSNALDDGVGQLLGAQSYSFHTGSGPDWNAPVLISQSVYNNWTVATNASVTFTFNEPIDAGLLNQTEFYPYYYADGSRLASTLAVSSDGRTITVTPNTPFVAGGHYQVCGYSVFDLVGNQTGGFCVSFFIGSGADTTPPNVVATLPFTNQTAVPTNAAIDVTFDEPIRNSSIDAHIPTITVNGVTTPVPNAYVVFNGYTVRMQLASLMLPNSTYTVTLTGLQDLSGNPMASPYSFSFTTGNNFSNVAANYLNATVQAGGVGTQLVNYSSVTNVSTSTTIQLAFDGVVDIGSILHNDGVRLYINGTQTQIPFTAALSVDGKTAILTPISALTGATQYLLYVNWYGNITDGTGRNTTNGFYYFFTTN